MRFHEESRPTTTGYRFVPPMFAGPTNHPWFFGAAIGQTLAMHLYKVGSEANRKATCSSIPELKKDGSHHRANCCSSILPLKIFTFSDETLSHSLNQADIIL